MNICNTRLKLLLTRGLLSKYHCANVGDIFHINYNPNRLHVSTWSPLANVFNTKSSRSPLYQRLTRKPTGLFCFDELKESSGFYLLQENVGSSCDSLVEEAICPNRKRKMVEIFDELSDTLCKVADMAEFVRTGHPDEHYANAAETVCLNINGLVEKLNTNRVLYEALKEVVEKGDHFPTDDVDRHVAKLFLFDFEQSGIHLDNEKREKVVALNDYILRVRGHYVHNSSLPRTVSKNSLPSHLSKLIPGETVEATGPLSDSNNEAYRELAYRVFLQPDNHQSEILDLLLSSRQSLAELCGFPSYSHRVLNGSLAGNPETVTNFLKQFSDAIRPLAASDYKEMLKVKVLRSNSSTELYPWDVHYFTTVIRQQRFQSQTSDYSCYFSLGACMEGLNKLFAALYNVYLQVEEPELGEIWDNDIIKLAVRDGETTLGYIYCDFFARPGKPHQDCHFTIRGGKVLQDGSYQMPVVTLFLTLPSPTWNAPSLLSPGMVDNLFHEMGHAMHSVLGRTKYQHITGTRCPTDFAEVPSILMEYFASDPRVVSSFARHYSTGKPIPEHLLSSLQLSKKMFAASEAQLQLFYSALDHELHLRYSLGKNAQDVLKEVQNEFYGLPHVPNTAWHLHFNHLVGYGARYYSYLMSRAVASWIWHTYFKDDPFSQQAGMKYRNQVLAHGGGKPPKELIESYLGTEATPENLVKGLILDVNS